MAVVLCHHHSESQIQCDEILVFQQNVSIVLLLLHIVPCGNQLAAICHLGQVVFLHWHRLSPSDGHHLCQFHSSVITNLLLCHLHHQCAWWWSWNGIGIMIQLPDNYTFQQWFISALWEMLCNEIIKRATMQSQAWSINYMRQLAWLRKHPTTM